MRLATAQDERATGAPASCRRRSGRRPDTWGRRHPRIASPRPRRCARERTASRPTDVRSQARLPDLPQGPDASAWRRPRCARTASRSGRGSIRLVEPASVPGESPWTRRKGRMHALVQHMRPHPNAVPGNSRHLARRTGAVTAPADNPPLLISMILVRTVGNAARAGVLRHLQPLLHLLERRPAAYGHGQKRRASMTPAASSRSCARTTCSNEACRSPPRAPRPFRTFIAVFRPAFSMRSDTTVDRFRASTPASARSPPGRATFCFSARDFFAVRRTSLTSARAAASFSRLLSKIAFREFARLRPSTSCKRSSSRRPSAAAVRASAASARIRSRSYRDFQVTASQHDDCGTSPAASDDDTKSSMHMTVHDLTAPPKKITGPLLRITKINLSADRHHRMNERLLLYPRVATIAQCDLERGQAYTRPTGKEKGPTILRKRHAHVRMRPRAQPRSSG